MQATHIVIKRLPEGPVRASDFERRVVTVPPLGEGQVRVRNEWMSLDPYMRLGLTQQDGYVGQLQPGDTLDGPAVGIVEESRDPSFKVGANVLSQKGWRSGFVADAVEAGLTPLADDVPLSWHLGILGLTGVTAWLGIEEVLCPTPGETIFISGAAGAVGSVACQLAKMRGARVLGSAGSAEKADWLSNGVGVDAVVNYREQSIDAFLDEHAPHGVDCYFDNVGGSTLETFLVRSKPGGRIGLCGAMSQYETGDYRTGPANFFAVIEKNLHLRGFNAFRLSTAQWSGIAAKLKALTQAGHLKPCETVVDTIDKVPDAFAAMFDSGHCGKLIVRI